MNDYTILASELYHKAEYGYSMFGDHKVCIVGEQVVEFNDGKIVEQYLYNIIGHAPTNGNLFVSLKANIILEKNGENNIE